jgi:CHAD domain-containing protein
VTQSALAIQAYLLQLMRHADHALTRLAHANDTAALHDLRVALRRLRTWLRAFGTHVGVDRTQQKQLRQLAHGSNPLRDREIELAWLRAQTSGLSRAQRRSVLALHRHGAQVYRRELRTLRVDLRNHWPPLARQLRRTLRSARMQLDARALHDVLRRIRHNLLAELKQVRTARDTAALHRARIFAKRLRYVLEPYRGVATDIAASITALIRLQDDFGAFHDGAIIRAALKHSDAPVIDILSRRARTQQRALFKTLRSRHLGKELISLRRLLRQSEHALKSPTQM